MRKRRLGNTGLMASEISFGTIPLLKGSIPVLPRYYNLEDEEAIDVMRYAYMMGCNLYDTAIVPEYGDAEIKLGKFAEFIGRENIIISDKARFFYGDEMYKAVKESTDNLKTFADIYFVHQVDYDNADLTFSNYGALEALYDLKKEGIIRFTGIASHYYDVLLRAAKDSRVDVLQISGNILERGMLERLEMESIFDTKGIIVNKVYAAGILTDFFDPRALISTVLSYPVSTALIGIGSENEADVAFQGHNSEYSRMPFENTIMELEKYFEPIDCDRCQKCECPYGTEIHTVFRQFNYFFLGKDFWALKKLGMSIKESALNCEGCVKMNCMTGCERNLRIPELIKKVEMLVSLYKI